MKKQVKFKLPQGVFLKLRKHHVFSDKRKELLKSICRKKIKQEVTYDD